MPAHLESARLGPLTKLASGGQGVVYAAPTLRMPYASSLVFKQHKPGLLGTLDVAVLDSMPAYLESLPFLQGMELLSQAAWPCRLVDDARGVIGFVMPAIPAQFYLQMRKSSGTSRELGEFQHLLNDDSFLARRNILVSERRRYELLGEVARALSVFHRHGIAVGDLSPKNLLFAHDQTASVYFVDCDAMRFQGRSVTPQLETPGWGVREVNPQEELGTVASDSYKLGLLALRLLTGTQDTRDPRRLPAAVPSAIRYPIINALSAHPDKRPRPAEWIGPLTTAAAAASTRTPAAVTATVPVVTSMPIAPLGPPQGFPWNVTPQPAQPVPQTVRRQGSAQAPTRYGPRPNRAAAKRNSNFLIGRLGWLMATVAGLVISSLAILSGTWARNLSYHSAADA